MIAASDELAKLGLKVTVTPKAAADDRRTPMRDVRLGVAEASGDGTATCLR
jgi:hypothetical protein